MARVAVAHSRGVLRAFLRSTHNAIRTQEAVLLEKVRRNTSSDFGRDFGFAGIRTYEDFIQRVPILRYEQLSPYIEKVKAGRIEAMFGPRQRVHMFAMTSGTTDQPKYIPVTGHFLKEYRRGWNAFGVKVLLDHPACFLRHIVQVTSPMDEERSSGGYPCGAITGILAATQKRLVRRYYVAPSAIASIGDAVARYYAVMRFAVPADVSWMVTANPATQLRLARIADENAEELVRDVQDGTLSGRMDIPTPIRNQLEATLSPDRAAATRLGDVVRRTGRLLPKDYWNLGFLANWTGGTMGLHLRSFPEYFGQTPVRDIGLLASEGRMSIPVEDGTASGILDVVGNFFEFIPAEQYENEQPTVLRAHELVLDREYFILLTNSAGFYRYDIGDRIRVTGFAGEAPLIEFLHKGVHTSSLTGEKLTERQVVMAFERAAASLHLVQCGFVLAPQWCEGAGDNASASGIAGGSGGDPPFYRLYVEEAGELGPDARRGLAGEFERHLRAINIEYASKQESGRLGPVELSVLPQGWLSERDRDLADRRHHAREQFKHRYLLSQPGEDGDFPAGALPVGVGPQRKAGQLSPEGS